MSLHSSLPTAGHRSFWLEEVAGDAPAAAPLTGAQRADVAVIGGGYVGLWSAIEIKLRQPSVDVVLLEADVCGSGASGRNGGFALSWWSKIALLPPYVGDEEALRLARASVEGIDDIRTLLADHGVECDFRQGGWIWGAATEAHADAWSSTLAECRRLGVSPFTVLDAAEVQRRTASPAYLGGVLDRTTARVHPARLARGLRQVALALGVRLHEHSAVTTLERRRPAVLHTDAGVLTADRVVIATNVWAAGMPELRRKLVAISSDMIVTAPIPDELARLGWTGDECISDSQMMIHYYRLTADGRVAFGKGGWGVAFAGRIPASFDRSPKRAAVVAQNFHRLYPQLADVPLTHDWSGAIDRSVTGIPLIGHTGGRPHIVHAVGWSANAVGPARTGAKLVASLILDEDDEWSRSPLVDLPARSFPPEPLRYLGAHVVRAGVVAKEDAEIDGRPPGRLAAFLAARAPSGMIPKR